MTYRPEFTQNVSRIQPVDPHHNEDQREERKKKRSQYQGRSWSEAEEDLAAPPVIPAALTLTGEKQTAGVYANQAVVERAKKLLSQLTTLEEKVAQLCILETDAIYDAALQHEVELLIQTWQVGGIFFKKGNYKRQAYLIERFQEVSKTPLLISNDFLHGLSFYLQGDALPKGPLSEKRFMDLGKAVTVQNRRLGVHVQFDRERYLHQIPMTDEQATAFRKGVRQAHGIVGKEKGDANSRKAIRALLSLDLDKGKVVSSVVEGSPVHDTIGFKTLTFFDASRVKKDLDVKLHEAFLEHYDVFLFRDNIVEGIRALCKLVRSGAISEAELDRCILKTLIIKSLFFN